MKIYKETLYERLRNRLPQSDARKAIRALRHARNRLHIDYMTVKELSELTEHYRTLARTACNAVREWELRDAVQKMDQAFRERERDLLRAQALDAIALYQDVKRDYIELRNLAMAQLTSNDSAPPKAGEEDKAA